MRILVVAGSVLAILLLGASAGLLITPPRQSTPTPAADSVDVGFSQDMSVHHRQAALMGGLARERASDAELRVIGYDIETTQVVQIGRMQGWLTMWNAASLPLGTHMRWMTGPVPGHSDGHYGAIGRARMPGMATEQELERLRRAAGVEFEVLFLQLMLRHHQGGMPMLTYAERHAEAPQVRNLAKQMLIAQTSETTVFVDLLADRGARPLPPT